MQENGITNFGAALTEIREQKILTIEQLAQSANILPADLREYEAGTKRPEIETIVSITKTFEISPFEIINRSLDKSKYFRKTA